MPKTAQNKNRRLFIYALFVLFSFLMIFTIFFKTNFHLDEISSYTLSNNIGDIFLSFEDFQKYSPVKDIFLQSMTASPTHRFNYANVFANQAADVHPPLYYILLHTICSFFPGTFSKWYAGVINIAFALLTLFFVHKLARAMFNGASTTSPRITIFLVSITFVFSAGIQNAVSFLRMYVMAMCWVTAFTFLLVDQIAKPHTRRFYLSLFAVAFLGAMTHYYCIVYTVFACAVYGVYLLAHKRWKETGLFAGAMALAGSVSVAVFPAMLQHMFFGYRGTEALDNLSDSSGYVERLKAFFGILSQQVFGGWLLVLLIFISMPLIYVTLKHFFAIHKAVPNEESVPSHETIWKFICASLPSVLYFFLISKMAAYATDRYVFPVYAVSLVWVLSLCALLIQTIVPKSLSVVILCFGFSVITVMGWLSFEGEYLYRDTSKLLDEAESYSDVDCLCVYDSVKGMVESSFKEACNYKSITFVSKSEIDQVNQLDFSSGTDMVLLLVEVEDQKQYINQVLSSYPQLNSIQLIGSHGFGTSYYLSSDTE